MNVLTIHRKFWKPLLLLALLVSGEGKTWGVEANANHPSLSSASVYAVSDDEFLPYEGIACKNGDFETNAAGEKRQHCFVWKYDYYVAPGTDVELKAPIKEGNEIEYTAYWRWYDDTTFKGSDRIYTNASHGNKLGKKYYDAQGRSEGLFYHGTGIQKIYYSQLASVVYRVPNEKDWKGDVIAADASRYTDWANYTSTFREPTLSMRYKFHLHPAKELADTIMGAILKGNAYEDHGNITLAVMSVGSQNTKHALRLDLRDRTQYWCYPYNKKLWAGETDKSDFSTTEMYQAKSFTWAIHIYVNGEYYYKPIERNKTRLLDGVVLEL